MSSTAAYLWACILLVGQVASVKYLSRAVYPSSLGLSTSGLYEILAQASEHTMQSPQRRVTVKLYFMPRPPTFLGLLQNATRAHRSTLLNMI